MSFSNGLDAVTGAFTALGPFGMSLLAALIAFGFAGFRVNQEWQRGVVYRLGRFTNTRGAGLYWIIPGFESVRRVDVRIHTVKLETQETVSRDGVAVRVNAVVWYKVSDPATAVNAVVDAHSAVLQASETALRDTLGQYDLDALLKHRDQVNAKIFYLLKRASKRWGLDVEAVEMRDLDIPETMQRALAREAEASREAKARMIKAQGEAAASATLVEAARAIEQVPTAFELRRLQTLSEIGVEQNTTIVLALPMDFISAAGGITKIFRNSTTRPGHL